ncbi:MAG: potassium channel family protein [Bacteroidales bacterium]|nr:potassium channel family protein [Bacteroidales bacterium]
MDELKELDFSNSIFQNGCGFLSTKFCDGDVFFINCEFNDNKMIDFCRAQFGTGKKYFNSTFNSELINFIGVIFGDGDVIFTEAEFLSKKVKFTNSEFGEGSKLFEEIHFEVENLNFDDCRFWKGDIVFTGTDFGDCDIDFTGSNGNVNNLFFIETRFGDGGLDFSNTKFPSAAIDFENAQFGNLDVKFNNMHCKSLNFENSYLFGDIFFLKTQISEILSLVNFRTDGSLYIDFLSNNLKELIYCQQVTFHKKSQQFLLLKQNFNKLGQFDDEDSAYVAYRRCCAKNQLEESKKKGFFIKTCAYIKYQFSKFIFYIPGEYGTRLGNVAITMLNTVFFFSFWFYSIPSLINFKEISFCYNDIWNRLAGSIYHSLITFLTIGYGDVAPKNWLGGLLSGIEGFIGLFLMAYFTIAFSRKVLR